MLVKPTNAILMSLSNWMGCLSLRLGVIGVQKLLCYTLLTVLLSPMYRPLGNHWAWITITNFCSRTLMFSHHTGVKVFFKVCKKTTTSNAILYQLITLESFSHKTLPLIKHSNRNEKHVLSNGMLNWLRNS